MTRAALPERSKGEVRSAAICHILRRSAPPKLESTSWNRAVSCFGRVLLSTLEMRKKVNYRGGKFEMPRGIQCGGTQDQRADQASIFTAPKHQMGAKRNLERPAY